VLRGQLSLLGSERPSFDREFRALRRTTLSEGAWLDFLPGWLVGHAEVFETLARDTAWRSEQRTMYDRLLDVPRLYAALPDDGPLHPIIEPIREALSAHYATSFDRISVALYRDGRDSVAWHGDHVARRMPSALVASVSVGAPRRLLLRPTGGGRSIPLSLGWGDLLVMGGSCQRTWQHCVPKVPSAPPRIVIMFRPTWSLPPDSDESTPDVGTPRAPA
jgi:alkylated DNA repair dioxygenase AlkB